MKFECLGMGLSGSWPFICISHELILAVMLLSFIECRVHEPQETVPLFN